MHTECAKYTFRFENIFAFGYKMQHAFKQNIFVKLLNDPRIQGKSIKKQGVECHYSNCVLYIVFKFAQILRQKIKMKLTIEKAHFIDNAVNQKYPTNKLIKPPTQIIFWGNCSVKVAIEYNAALLLIRLFCS